MSNVAALVILVVAASLEAGGDAVVRTGLHAGMPARKAGLLAAGGLVLLAYGMVVNAPSWDFGRLLGVYVALFFVAAQLINFVAFHIRPGIPIMAGGFLIVAGGLLMTLWR